MKALAIPGAIVLGALVGAGGYFAASKLSPPPEPKQTPPATSETAEIRKTLADIQACIVKLETRVDAVRSATSTVPPAPPTAEPPGTTPTPVVQAPPPTRPQPESWRTIIPQRYRTSYHTEILGDLRKELKIDDAKWKELQPIFDEHFAPVEAKLKEVEAGKEQRLPQVNNLLSPQVPATLAKLKEALPAEAWQAFDAWRKSWAKLNPWGPGKGDYFLDGEAYKDYRVKQGAARNWPLLQARLAQLYEVQPMVADKRARFEAVLKAHLEQAVATVRDQDSQNLFAPTVRAKLKTLTEATEVELGKILGPEGLAEFRKWKKAPLNPACQYFGEPYRQHAGDIPVEPGQTAPPTVTGPPEQF